ncbi:MAG: GntR family transcriptional regulator [Sporolactobacillus sp.]|nr:GntR family transcriptional regulator [Sporolactobacillus sp.]
MIRHEEISKIIARRIKNRVYPPLSQIPTQNELAKEFHTSRVTVKRAIDTLVNEGLLVSNRGSGTYVMTNPLVNKLNFSGKSYRGLTATMGDEKDRITNEILQFDSLFPDERLQKILLLDRSQPVYRIVRLRNLDQRPFQLEHTFMPIHVIPGITEKVLSASIYSHIQDVLGLKIGRSYRVVKADKPDHWDLEYLECQKNDPVLEVEQVVYLDNGVPFEYSRSRHRYDKGGIVFNN